MQYEGEFSLPNHLSVRIAWHDNGWNGRVCNNPSENVYCVGRYSYPGDVIASQRNLEWEEENSGEHAAELTKVLPCSYSINAFGDREITAENEPPGFFNDNTKTAKWTMPPYSISTWPYEAMYDESAKSNGRFDPELRAKNMREYFADLEQGTSLIFYYANYDNPFSGEDKKYVLVGVARLKKIGDEMTYENQSEESLNRFGGFVWGRVIQSNYAEEGMRIPYHRYMDNEEILSKLAFIPENQRNFKYGTRKFSDDEALGLIERFLDIAHTLKEIGDTTEDWNQRINWLSSLINELWEHRGLLPGLPAAMNYINFSKAIPYIKTQIAKTDIREIKETLFDMLEGKAETPASLNIDKAELKKIQRHWKIKEDEERIMLKDVLPRFDLSKEQIERIVSENREESGIYSSLSEIIENPYLLNEEYIGDDTDDRITFYKIDHGIFPSPDLGEESLMDTDDPRRLKALCCEVLKQFNQHAFLDAKQILNKLNKSLSHMPEYKKDSFTMRHIEVDEDELAKSLYIRKTDQSIYLYRKHVHELERQIEKVIRTLLSRSKITLKYPVTDDDWENMLYSPDSPILEKAPDQYKSILNEQVEICRQIFRQPISIIHGEAGTGKTTILKSIINGIMKAHGEGTTFQLLAPTGKAADRLRERTGKAAETIHSFLAKRGWLNNNMTFKRSGGTVETNVNTYIIDEASMIDVNLLATLFKAINLNTVQRLIFVGDVNQLPPIGVGKPFADILHWLKNKFPESVGMLKTNCRQLESGGISLKLASLYTEGSNVEKEINSEEVLQKVQKGGKIDKDLSVVYWNDGEELKRKIYQTIISDIEEISGEKVDPDRLWEDFRVLNQEDGNQSAEAFQIISPYRGEAFGTEAINQLIQDVFNGSIKTNKGNLGGVSYFDKVIQYKNRPKSNPYYAYNMLTKSNEKVQVFNGELGFVHVHPFDKKKWLWNKFRLKQFQVLFNRKEHYRVSFDSKSAVEENLELAYAISVHKSQGSEFKRVYFVLPKSKKRLLSKELFYTGITRAQVHTTLFVEEDISPLLSLSRKEASELIKINSSTFEFEPIPLEFFNMDEWYEEGKIHRTLSDHMVQSKNEVIIANILFEEDIPFQYDVPLYADDGTFYRPDFTLQYSGEEWYIEHLGMLNVPSYRQHWEKKKKWYEKHRFSQRLIVTDDLNGVDAKAWRNVILDSLNK